MRLRYFKSRDRREPEKTPLIDVIFLLLIFFFVAIVGLDLTPKPRHGPKSGGSKKKLELLAMSNPTEPAPDSLKKNLLLQIRKGSHLDEALVQRMNEVIRKGRRIGIDRYGVSLELKRDAYVLLLLDTNYPDQASLKRLLLQLERLLENLGPDSPAIKKDKAKELMRYVPVNLPLKRLHELEPGEFNRRYDKAIDYVTQKIKNYFETDRDREIFIHMTREIYVKVIQDLFRICNDEDVGLENLKFRVIEKTILSS